MQQIPRRQGGFTIIELVVVILLLGILAATALPRFIDVTDEAHQAAFEATYGGFGTGVAMARSQWFADGQDTSAGNTVSLRGQSSVAMTANGYPDGAAVGECSATYSNILQSGRPVLATASYTNDTSALAITQANVNSETGATDDFLLFFSSDTSGATTSYRCYFVYVGQYENHLAATTAGASGIPYFYYEQNTGNVISGTTADLDAT